MRALIKPNHLPCTKSCCACSQGTAETAAPKVRQKAPAATHPPRQVNCKILKILVTPAPGSWLSEHQRCTSFLQPFPPAAAFSVASTAAARPGSPLPDSPSQSSTESHISFPTLLPQNPPRNNNPALQRLCKNDATNATLFLVSSSVYL